MTEETISVEDMAGMHDVAPNTIYLILRKDATLPEAERRIPGAYKVGSKYRGEWRIPLSTARNWQPSKAGRPKDAE